MKDPNMQVTENLLEWAVREIQRPAAFYFHGSTQAYREIETLAGMKRIIYRAYGYKVKAEADPSPLVHKLVDDIALAIGAIESAPLCIVWRRHPALERMPEEDGWKCVLRLAVVDRNLNQIELRLPPIEDGGLIPEMPNESV